MSSSSSFLRGVLLLLGTVAHAQSPWKCSETKESLQLDVEPPAPKATCNNGVVNIPHDSRSYLYDENTVADNDPTVCDASNRPGGQCQSWTSGAFFLGNKVLEMDVDLSRTECGCNAAMYFVAMPDNAVQNECGDYYCDANGVCGSAFCAEIDIMEANKVAWKTVTHHKYDRGGISAGWGRWLSTEENNAFVLVEGQGNSYEDCMYGPSVECAINTNLIFRATFIFDPISAGQDFSYNTILSQDGRAIETGPLKYTGNSPFPGGTISPGPANQRIANAFDRGLTLVASYWGGPGPERMEWLDTPCDEFWCQGDVFTDKDYPWMCPGQEPEPRCEGESYRISNIVVKDISEQDITGPPTDFTETFYIQLFEPGFTTPAPNTVSPVAPPTPAPVLPPSQAPVLPTAAPIIPTEAPIVPTASPVALTTAPVAPTASPVVPTSTPVAITDSPVEAPTVAPILPTLAPVVASTPVPVTAPTLTPVDIPVPSQAPSSEEDIPGQGSCSQVCPKGVKYHFNPMAATWEMHQILAHQMGCELASVTSQEEQEAAIAAMEPYIGYPYHVTDGWQSTVAFLGAVQTAANPGTGQYRFTWVDGAGDFNAQRGVNTQDPYTNFIPSDPNDGTGFFQETFIAMSLDENDIMQYNIPRGDWLDVGNPNSPALYKCCIPDPASCSANEKEYHFNPTEATFEEHLILAEAQGCELASIQSAEDQLAAETVLEAFIGFAYKNTENWASAFLFLGAMVVPAASNPDGGFYTFEWVDGTGTFTVNRNTNTIEPFTNFQEGDPNGGTSYFFEEPYLAMSLGENQSSGIPRGLWVDFSAQPSPALYQCCTTAYTTFTSCEAR